jgi:hypothetical protein
MLVIEFRSESEMAASSTELRVGVKMGLVEGFKLFGCSLLE